MQLLRQLGIIFAFGFAGEVIASLLPFALPASVIGMLLLLAALLSGLLKEEQIGGVAGFLTANMGFFFVPSSVNTLQSFDTIRPVLWKMVLICAVGAGLTFLTTYATVRAVQLLQAKGRRSR